MENFTPPEMNIPSSFPPKSSGVFFGVKPSG